MSYRGDLGAQLGQAAATKVIGAIPIVGNLFDAFLGLVGAFQDPTPQIVAWQNWMQRQQQVTRKYSSPKSQRRNLQRARVAAARRMGAPVFVTRRRSRR